VTSIDQAKRTQALTAWAKCGRNTYGIIAQFTHVNKDMAEIGMLREVWNAKISLCWWHLRQAVRTRLASRKLSTTPYDPGCAHAQFSFINIAFVPASQADGEEYEASFSPADNGAAGAPVARAKHVAPSTATAAEKENIPLGAIGGVQGARSGCPRELGTLQMLRCWHMQ
jgi:hypothetical protein